MPEPNVKQEQSKGKSKKRKIKSKLTEGNIDRYQKRLYLENLPSLVENGYKQVLAKAKEGNMKAIEICLQLANLYKPATGQINIVNQIYSKSGNSGDSAASVRTQSFESILRRLEATEQAALPAPGSAGQVDIVDAEVVEV